jgi:hypothetical protein
MRYRAMVESSRSTASRTLSKGIADGLPFLNRRRMGYPFSIVERSASGSELLRGLRRGETAYRCRGQALPRC